MQKLVLTPLKIKIKKKEKKTPRIQSRIKRTKFQTIFEVFSLT